MKASQAFYATAVLALTLGAATVWADGAGQAGQADQSQAPPASEGWKHFGVNADVAQPTPSTPSSGWHYFGTANAATANAIIKPPRVAAERPHKATATIAKSHPSSQPDSMSALEYEMAELVNRDRLDPANAAETGGHVQALRWNSALAAAARGHSRDMLERKYFSHVDREGRSPGTRVKAAGIGWQAVGENIAIYENVPKAEAAFMDEPRFAQNHRSNILDRRYTDVGVGIVQGPDGRYYITQEFIETPRDLRASFQH